jgi:hypothetical protein
MINSPEASHGGVGVLALSRCCRRRMWDIGVLPSLSGFAGWLRRQQLEMRATLCNSLTNIFEHAMIFL